MTSVIVRHMVLTSQSVTLKFLKIWNVIDVLIVHVSLVVFTSYSVSSSFTTTMIFPKIDFPPTKYINVSFYN